ncbi:sucrose-phosphate synthase 4-like [Prosopis cineraria]|uniref:sucrose-phosphate synthase 4-like n=1 Tax=Prosopis cineraria TaxID=364024 RepID=UPI002410929E|nr:sucrose-phosphate synthase 4-like [Prosopis cineraria]
MAVNEWLNGYLEAILDVGGRSSSIIRKRSSTDNSFDGKHRSMIRFEEERKLEEEKDDDNSINNNKLFSPTKYFVEEVINSFDEFDLYRTWVKVIATRNSRDRSNRMENMCWRIWHLTRKKKQIAWDDAQKLAKRRIEREQGRNDAADDLSELSEGEKEKDVNNASESRKDIPRISSEMQLWSDDNKSRNLYIVLISIHGWVRGENMELGRDSDTGGQVKYGGGTCSRLANTKGIYRVDLLTRQITSPEVDSSYGEPIEMLSCPPDGSGSCGAYIIPSPMWS